VSSSSLSDTILGPDGALPQSSAAESRVSLSLVQNGGHAPQADADAAAVVNFTPNFSGPIDGIAFYGQTNPFEHWGGLGSTPADLLGTAYWSIIDLADGSLIANDSLNAGNEPDWGAGILAAKGYQWQVTHTYQLTMFVGAGTNAQPNSGWLATNLFSVDEPSMRDLLVATLLFGLVGVFAKSRVRQASVGRPTIYD
jgi:hypothetical protein